MALCPTCGTESTARFCTNCGAPMPVAAPTGATPVPPPAPQVAASVMAPPPAPAPGTQYAAPTGQQYPPYQAPPAAPGSVWQGVVTLIVGVLTALFLMVGVGLNTTDPDFATIKVGGQGLAVVAGIIVLILGIWGLVKNRKSGKVMSTIGLAAWLLIFAYVFLA